MIQNLYPPQKTISLELEVHKKKRIKKYILSTYQQNDIHAAHFHRPARDRGTKFLRKKENLWILEKNLENLQ